MKGAKYPLFEIIRLHDRTQVNLTQLKMAPLPDHSRVFNQYLMANKLVAKLDLLEDE